jgi:beta-lactamase class D
MFPSRKDARVIGENQMVFPSKLGPFTSIAFLSIGMALLLSNAYAQPSCTVVTDAATGKVAKQDGTCDQRVTPASTFKIALSLMGYDSGYLTDEHLPALPYRDGYPDWVASWKATTDPTSWIKNSVVWYSQRFTEWLGEDRFQKYVAEFRYGNEDVSGDAGKRNGLTQAWLNSSLKISPLDQVAFLEKVVNRQLPISPNAYVMTARITSVGTLPNGWEVHGKTGTGFPIRADGTADEVHAYGWFVGWASKDARTYVFARFSQDGERHSIRAGLRVRDALMAELPSMLDTL